MKKNDILGTILIIGLIIGIVFLINFVTTDHKVSPRKSSDKTNIIKDNPKFTHIPITFDGYERGRLEASYINVWEFSGIGFSAGKGFRDYGKIVAKVRHGEKGYLLKRIKEGNKPFGTVGQNDKCYIETKSGKRGWISWFFIKELKGDF